MKSTFFTLFFLILAFASVQVEFIVFTLLWLVNANTTFRKAFVTFRRTFLASFYPWTTKHNLLLTTIQGPVLVLPQGMPNHFL